MGLLGLVCVGIPLFIAGMLLQSFLLNIAAGMVGGVDIGLAKGVGIVIVADLAQAIFSGIFLGADVGLCGSLAALCVWAGMLSALTPLRFVQSLIVGVLMALLGWLMGWLLVLGAIALGVTALMAVFV